MHLKANNIYFINDSLYIKYDYKMIENVSLNLENEPSCFMKKNLIKVYFSFYLHDEELPKKEEALLFEESKLFDLKENQKYLEENGIDAIKVAEAISSLSISKDPANSNVTRLRKLATTINEILKIHPIDANLINVIVNRAKCKKILRELINEIVKKGSLENDE